MTDPPMQPDETVEFRLTRGIDYLGSIARM
jgi:hypothetical protein